MGNRKALSKRGPFYNEFFIHLLNGLWRPFGIIAGGLNKKNGFNPLILVDDDGTLAVEETKLNGCKDFILIPGLHSTLLWQNEVIRQIILFIEDRRFEH